MVSMSSELRLRIVSALVLAAVSFGEVWVGGWLFAVFVSAIAFIVFLEWTAIIGLSAFENARLRACFNMFLVLAILVLLGPKAALAGLILFVVLAHIATASTTQETAYWTSFATLYCGLAAISLVSLRDSEQGISAILLLFGIVWGTDIGAYFVGRKFGGPKLAPAISPGKTQSGAVGGLVVAVVAAVLVAAFTQIINLYAAVFIAAFVSLVSQIGDLFESYLKRRFGVKDSGSIMPGHGGMFDRVDGLMPAAIALFIILKLI